MSTVFLIKVARYSERQSKKFGHNLGFIIKHTRYGVFLIETPHIWWEEVDSNHRSRRRQIYSLEDMAQKDPDVILVFAHFNEEYAFSYIEGLTKSDAVWKNFRAVKNKRIYYLSTADGFGVSANLDWTQALETLRPIFFGE